METRKFVKSALWFTLFAPIGWIAWKTFEGGASANPAKDLNHLFGQIGFYALVLNITIGSYKALAKKPPRWFSWIIPYRRHLGVAGFFYLVVHVTLHFIIEGDLNDGFQAIAEAVYLWFAIWALLGMILLAVTSNNFSVRKLGRRWKSLHKIVYVVFFLAATHTLLIEKADLVHFGILTLVVTIPLLVRLTRYIFRQFSRREESPIAL